MRRTLAFVTLAAACCLAGSEPRPTGAASPWQISNRGTPVSVQSSVELARLRRATVDAKTLRELRWSEGIGVFLARSTRDEPCFVTRTAYGFGLTACGSTEYPFPSARVPTLDLTTLRARRSDRAPRIVALVGIAADGVARVGVVFDYGPPHVVPVVANTYIDRTVPPRPARMIVASDARGKRVAALPLLLPHLGRSGGS
jgi:hypothetical protein